MSTKPRVSKPVAVIDPHGRQRGVSMLEVSIVSVMTVASLGVFYGAATSVSDMTVSANKESRRRAVQSNVLETIRKELESAGKDESRISIADDGFTITYQKLVGAEQNGADVSGVWSPSYTISLDRKSGQVTRKEGRRTVCWGTGIKALKFQRAAGSDQVTVGCVTERAGELKTRVVHVYPRN